MTSGEASNNENNGSDVPPRRVLRVRLPSGARFVRIAPADAAATAAAAALDPNEPSNNTNDNYDNNNNLQQIHPSWQGLRRRRRRLRPDHPLRQSLQSQPTQQSQAEQPQSTQQSQAEQPQSTQHPTQQQPMPTRQIRHRINLHRRPLRMAVPQPNDTNFSYSPHMPPPPPAAADASQVLVVVPPLQPKILPDTQQDLQIEAQNTALQDVPTCAICWEHIGVGNILACPYQDSCTAHFCANCIHKYKQTARPPISCPMCQRSVTEGIFPRQEALEQILQATLPPVPCRFAQCSAVLPVAELAQHEASCPCQRVTCRFHSIGCAWQGYRSDLPQHEQSCALEPLSGWIDRQRRTNARLEAQMAVLTRELAARRHQHAAFLENHVLQTEERLRRIEARFEHLEHEQSQSQRPATSDTPSQPPPPAPLPPSHPHANAWRPTLAQLLLVWVQIWKDPRSLQRRSRVCDQISVAWVNLPDSMVAVCTALDMWYTCSFVLAGNPSDRQIDSLVVVPWGSIGLLFVLAVTNRYQQYWKSRMLHALVSWLFWSVVIWWYRTTDQCLSIWLATTSATCLGFYLFSSQQQQQQRFIRDHLLASAYSWISVMYGVLPTLLLLFAFSPCPIAIRVTRSIHTEYNVPLLILFGPPCTAMFLCFSFLEQVGKRGETLIVFGLFYGWIECLLLACSTLGLRLRHHANKWPFRSLSVIILVLLSWSIADCLYMPLISLVPE